MFDAIKKWFANLHKLPEAQMAEFRSEGLVAVDEWIKSKITFRNYKAPGKRFLYKTVWLRSCIVLTKKRFFATAYTKLAIDVPLADERFRKMEFTVEDDGRLLVTFDASLFQPTWSGTLEYRFVTGHASQFATAIQQEMAANG